MENRQTIPAHQKALSIIPLGFVSFGYIKSLLVDSFWSYHRIRRQSVMQQQDVDNGIYYHDHVRRTARYRYHCDGFGDGMHDQN